MTSQTRSSLVLFRERDGENREQLEVVVPRLVPHLSAGVSIGYTQLGKTDGREEAVHELTATHGDSPSHRNHQRPFLRK